jgi:hypothetical protein
MTIVSNDTPLALRRHTSGRAGRVLRKMRWSIDGDGIISMEVVMAGVVVDERGVNRKQRRASFLLLHFSLHSIPGLNSFAKL